MKCTFDFHTFYFQETNIQMTLYDPNHLKRTTMTPRVIVDHTSFCIFYFSVIIQLASGYVWCMVPYGVW